MSHIKTLTAVAALLLISAPAAAQQSAPPSEKGSAPASVDSVKAAKPANVPTIGIQHMRPYDKRGLNIFEPPKDDAVPFTGFRLDFGAAFTQQFQSLEHENTATSRVVNNVNQNELIEIGPGFNNAVANLYLNAQLAPGIRVALTTYLSSRRHQETWVKDGYVLIDESPLDVPLLKTLMQNVTVKAGHFEINYGDAHFRRSDNGNAMYNPFVGNYILDAFTTEIGGEVYFRHHGWLAMGAITGGEIKGNVTQPDDRGPSFIGKVGFDRQVTPALRLRLTGSAYLSDKSASNTLYGGDRAGSRYYMVVENTAATTNGNPTSGLVNPGFKNEVTAYMVNPFVKAGGLELFGVLERAQGRARTEATERTWNQYAVDGVYRFLEDEKLFLGARYNYVQGELLNVPDEVSIHRTQFGAGWFVMPTVLLKGEYVLQKYHDFPLADIRRGGRFNGFVVEGTVAF